MEQTKKSGFGTAGLVLGIIGTCTSFIPIVNNLSFVMGILAVIFGIVALVKKSGKGKAIAALILGILAIAITLNMQKTWSDALEDVSKELDKATGSSTEEILKNDADVSLGKFEATTDKYGITTTKLNVKVTNKTSETKSFSIHIEAVDEDGTRLEDAYVYANDLNAGQSQNFEAFTFVSSDKVSKMKKATFKIVEVSMI